MGPERGVTMTDAEPTLFDAPATRGRFRKDGPASSRRSGESMFGQHLRNQQILVLVGLVHRQRRLCNGANAWETSCELVERGAKPPAINAIGTRFGELCDENLIEHLEGQDRPGESSRPQKVFRPLQRGFEWADAWLAAHPEGVGAVFPARSAA